MTGFTQAIDGIRILADTAFEDAVQTLQDVGEDAADEARRIAPVKTGRLRSSIRMEPKEDGARVLAEASYAGFVEWGTRYMEGRGYMSRPMSNAVDRLISKYERRLGTR